MEDPQLVGRTPTRAVSFTWLLPVELWGIRPDSSHVMDPFQINPNSIVCWSTAPVATEVNDEVILMNLDRDRCYGLGATASDIWRRIRTPIRVSELSSQLEDHYAAQPGEIESDVLRTLRQLAEEGLIEVRTGGN